MTPEAGTALADAEVIVGYKPYVSLIDPDILAKREVITTGMKMEMERCRTAMNRAAEGKKTVLVSSGDPGIYAMAGLMLEIVDKAGLADRIDVEIIPGIPALCAAAARLGAPLMHDFAVVSLSDLMTPWELIRKRMAAALDADFVIVIYNPRSRKRMRQLSEVRDMIIRKRGGKTLVGIVKNAARKDESVSITRMEEMDESAVDMLTILIVGNSETKQAGKWMVTPRGYVKKYGVRADT